MSQRKLESICKKARREAEDYYEWDEDKTAMKGNCWIQSQSLGRLLIENGFDVVMVHGCYLAASEDFEPNTEDWDEEDVEWYNKQIEQFGRVTEAMHTWLEVDNKWWVDITADQFHPGEEDEYRIIIAEIGDERYRKERTNAPTCF